jgi:hypothetical protein
VRAGDVEGSVEKGEPVCANVEGGEVGVVGAEELGEEGLEMCCCASLVRAAIFSRNCCTAVSPCVCVGGGDASGCGCATCVT